MEPTLPGPWQQTLPPDAELDAELLSSLSFFVLAEDAMTSENPMQIIWQPLLPKGKMFRWTRSGI